MFDDQLSAARLWRQLRLDAIQGYWQVEIADAREAQRSYEANLRSFDNARQMSRSLLDLLKR